MAVIILRVSLALQALAARELAVREGRLATLIFLRSSNSRGQEVSAFIDYAQRLADGGIDAFFAASKLEPQADDLSYYNWTTRTARVTASSSFEVRIVMCEASSCNCNSCRAISDTRLL